MFYDPTCLLHVTRYQRNSVVFSLTLTIWTFLFCVQSTHSTLIETSTCSLERECRCRVRLHFPSSYVFSLHSLYAVRLRAWDGFWLVCICTPLSLYEFPLTSLCKLLYVNSWSECNKERTTYREQEVPYSLTNSEINVLHPVSKILQSKREGKVGGLSW
jgi:hypothetical protein